MLSWKPDKDSTYHHDERLLLVDAFLYLAQSVQQNAILEPFEPDASRRAQRNAQKTVRLWDLRRRCLRDDGRLQRVCAGHDARILQRCERCFLLLEHSLNDELVALVDALEHRKLAADVVKLINVRQVGSLQHFPSLKLLVGPCEDSHVGASCWESLPSDLVLLHTQYQAS